MRSNISNTKKEKINLIKGISDFCNVPDRFKNSMKKSLLKLSHSDLSNVALGLVVYPKHDTMKYDKDGNIISISFGWCAEDVEWIMSDQFKDEKPLTPAEISDVLYYCDKRYDSDNGSTWDTLALFVEDILEKRTERKAKCQ